MTGRVQALTGHPETVQALVDEHLVAAARGPIARDAALAAVTPETRDACYRALLDRPWQETAARAANARIAARAATARGEADQIRRGGTR